MSSQIVLLSGTAFTVGVLHTLLGPDHYVPFVALSRARRWSLRKTLWVTLGCGVGHLIGSVALGLIGIGLGLYVGGLERVEATRGNFAGWMLIGFGIAYLAWGIVRVIRRTPHSHLHAHADGTLHLHPHSHDGDHLHVHDAPSGSAGAEGEPPRSAGVSWVLFIVFLFGPCEPLIPLLMYPAAQLDLWSVGIVTAVFGLATLGTMLGAVATLLVTTRHVHWSRAERFAEPLAGAAILACGLLIKLGF